ncbi:MAG: type VI secretion system-associated FHA domain protein TagH [Gammaproteobacteria bacterium]|nr:type VI secretion system-associated FHA domain protein TagH [Gammaproteobacteria bacterium]
MQLLLTVRKNNGAEQNSYSHCFDEAGGTIGRSSRNDWTLADPDRYISERHARIKFRNGVFELTDLSTNGTYHNDDRRRIRRHASVILESGDELSMGNLQIEVKILGDSAPSQRLPEERQRSGRDSSGGDTIPLEALKDQSPGSEPEPEPEPARERAGSNEWRSDSGNRPDSLKSRMSGARWSRAFSNRRRSALRAGNGPENVRRTAERTPSGDDTTRAILRELGIEELSAELDPEVFGREVGRILRMVAGGLMEALGTRSEVKDGFRIDPTRMRAAGNNPLKSSGTMESALRRLFRKDEEGIYIRGVPAFREAFEDLHIHELAMLSAVHASIESVISDFDPGPLKKKLKQIAPVSAATPVLNSAKCWNLYEEHYQEVAAQLRDDARLGFLKEFSKAYESATQQLRTNPKPGKKGEK